MHSPEIIEIGAGDSRHNRHQHDGNGGGGVFCFTTTGINRFVTRLQPDGRQSDWDEALIGARVFGIATMDDEVNGLIDA